MTARPGQHAGGSAVAGRRRAPRRWRRAAACLALALAVAFGGRQPAGAAGRDEYQVKAAYLYNFAKFVDWPADAFALPTSPLVIGVYGTDPFGSTLDDLLRDKQVGGRPFQIRRSVRMPDLRNSHIVFVGDAAEPVAAALGELAGTSVLTVGQGPRFLEEGGMVMLQVEQGRVVFAIDDIRASQARLTISSQLLRLARLNVAGRQ